MAGDAVVAAGAPNEALVRVGAERAVVRAEGEREGRRLLLEAEVPARGGRVRVQVNRQPLGAAASCSGRCGSACSAPTT